MNHRFRSMSLLPETHVSGPSGSRFAMIEPQAPQYFGAASPAQLHEIAFLHARALVERTRWQRLLKKIFEQDE
jgi:hypothetical protein